MASPGRRSSYSRREQYGVFTGYVIAGAGALAGAILLGLSLWRPANFNGPRTTASDIVAPIGEAGASARNSGKGLIDSISGYLAAGSQNAELRKEVEASRIRLAEAEATKRENDRLKALLGLSNDETPPVAVARLIGSTASSSRRFGYIGVGRGDGIVPGMPVRSSRGIVGRVLEVGRSTSRVLLLADSQSVVPVRLADSKRDVVALAEGRGDGLLHIRLVNLGINPLERGDVLVTSGSGGFYPPGVAVAIVEETVSDGAVARMISDPAATLYVTVEPIWQAPTIEAARTPVEDRLEE
ncbi:rod shape-determining protein MreC [Qipengyuania sp. JC766]|uniref:rod shape-determining protein MreC n=1 Tax=Qipengyuania sp. JC766 TaxID=3232139 RepID=UPI00345816EE